MKPVPQSAALGVSRAERAASPASVGENDHARAAVPLIDPWLRAGHVALVGLFVIALVWCAYVAQPVIVPVLLAWVIATIALPAVTFMIKHGLARSAAAVIVAVTVILLIVSLLVLLSTPVAFWLGRATELGALIQEKLRSMNQPLAVLEELRKVLSSIGAGGPVVQVEQPTTMVATIVSIMTPAVSQFILFMGALIFYLVYQTRLRSAVVYLFGNRDTRLLTLRILSDIDENMSRYFGAFTLINLCLGMVTALITWVIGLPNPLLWGVLAAVLNYIPYIGPAIVVGTLAVVGLLSFATIGEALIAPAIFVIIVTVEGQFLTPALMGRQLDLNPFGVFLSIAFCTWLWGPLGAFLAVPLLMALSVILGRIFAEEGPELPE